MNVAIIGEPNAGKSTLINRFVGSKVSAVSSKSHTTRKSTLGVTTIKNNQICFLDTPGITDDSSRTTRELAQEAWDSLLDVDIVMLLVDSVKTIPGDKNLQFIYENLKKKKSEHKEFPSCILVLNKVDLFDKIPAEKKKPIIERFTRHFPDLTTVFSKVFSISALNGKKVLDLQNWLTSQAKPRNWEYHPDVKTDQSELQICEEIIREKIFKRINKEVPYAITLQNVGWTYLPNGSLRIDENILVKKPGHKKMVLGKSGKSIYGIIETASQDIQAVLNRDVTLILNVKLDKSNNNNTDQLL
uniref:Era-type G domain-containing protein n=1 Tax=Arcella intermedia TaxID=1963864 RepID=A0A6B2LBJ0_9EUKA